MFERFTDEARKAVVLAQQEAVRLHHRSIGTEHLLLALTRGEGTPAAEALALSGVDLPRARAALEEVVGQGDAPRTSLIPFTPGAKKALELALREALALGHRIIGTEHLLLGLLAEGEDTGVQLLSTLGVDLPTLRLQLEDLGEGVPARAVPELRAPPLLDGLDDGVLHALLAARALARDLSHGVVGPGHLLAALVAPGVDDTGAMAVREAGADPERLRALLAEAGGPAGRVPPVPPLDRQLRALLLHLPAPVTTRAVLSALVTSSAPAGDLLRAAGADMAALEERLAAG
jgi:hypothetical protein